MRRSNQSPLRAEIESDTGALCVPNTLVTQKGSNQSPLRAEIESAATMDSFQLILNNEAIRAL